MSARPQPAQNEDSYVELAALLSAQLIEQEAAREAAEERERALQERLTTALASTNGLQTELARLREQLEGATSTTQASIQKMGERLEAGLAALSASLVTEPAPDELEFYIRRDHAGKVSTIIAKAKP